MKHLGPDSFGRWIDAQTGVVLAHRRLSIVDISHAGLQQMESVSKRYIVCFHGGICNHKQRRSEIDQGPHGFHRKGHSDTETLLACIETFGLAKSLKKIEGMFAFCLKELRYKRVPNKLIEMSKMGLGVPIGYWLGRPLRDWARNLLETNRLESERFFNVSLVRKKWDDHLSNRADWGHELWSVLMFEAWSDKWLANNRV